MGVTILIIGLAFGAVTLFATGNGAIVTKPIETISAWKNVGK
jgi:hypothetical protein